MLDVFNWEKHIYFECFMTRRFLLEPYFVSASICQAILRQCYNQVVITWPSAVIYTFKPQRVIKDGTAEDNYQRLGPATSLLDLAASCSTTAFLGQYNTVHHGSRGAVAQHGPMYCITMKYRPAHNCIHNLCAEGFFSGLIAYTTKAFSLL